MQTRTRFGERASRQKCLKEYWNNPRFEGKKPRRSRAPDNIYRPTTTGDLEQVENETHTRMRRERSTA
jgi:hypothetical protein